MKRLLVLTLSFLMALATFISCGENESVKDYVPVDPAALAKIVGDYQAVEFDNGVDDDYIGGYWHLTILNDDEKYGNYLTIYDNEAGNPGVEGEIVSTDDSNIVIKIDPDYYDQLPSYHWKDAGEYLEMTYTKTDDGIELTNNGYTVKFNEE